MKKRLISILFVFVFLALVIIPAVIQATEIEEKTTAEKAAAEQQTAEQQNINRNHSLDISASKADYQELISKIIYEIDPSGTRHFRNLLIKEQADAEILSCERDRQGFKLTILKEDTDENEKPYHYKETVSFHIAEQLPEFDTQEEMRDFFLDRYPDATMYYVFLLEDDKKPKKDFFYIIEENDITYAHFTYMGQAYEMTDEGCDSGYNCVYDMRNKMGFDYTMACQWGEDEDGDFWQNFIDHIFYLEKDIGTGEKFYFQLVPPAYDISDNKSQLDPFESEMEVSVYREGSTLPFQIFLTSSDYYYSGHSMISFEDFNSDGYLDLTILRDYGANGGTAFHYIWSPEKEQFIKGPDELEYFGSYWMHMDTRRLYMHYHGSAITGTEFTYQWENEMDCRLIKKFVRDWAGDELRFLVMDYNGKKERILLDYTADYDGDESAFAWNFYDDDILWEKEISDPASGEIYHLYYAQRPVYEVDENEGRRQEGYAEHLYVIDDRLQPVNYLEWESEAAYTEVSYIEQDNGKGGMLEVGYTDGRREQYSFSEMTNETNVEKY